MGFHVSLRAGPGGPAFCMRQHNERPNGEFRFLTQLIQPIAHLSRDLNHPFSMAGKWSCPGKAAAAGAYIGTVRPAQYPNEEESAAAPGEHRTARVAIARTEACDCAASARGVYEAQLQ
jgi:hypothetical protein